MHLMMFDIDGTLTQTNESSDVAFLGALADVMDITEVDTDWTTYTNVTDQGCLEEIVRRGRGRLPTQGECGQIRERYVELLKREAERDPSIVRPTPGAVEAFADLCRRSDVTVALATGTWYECACLKLGLAGFEFESMAMATASDSAAREEIMKLAETRVLEATQLRCFATRTYVGDAVWDVRASQSLSYNFIGISQSERAQALRRAGATRIVEDFTGTDFFTFLEEIWA